MIHFGQIHQFHYFIFCEGEILGKDAGRSERRGRIHNIESEREERERGSRAKRSEAKSVPDFQLSSVSEGSNKLFWVVELTVSSGADLIDNGGLEIDEESARNVFTGAGFAEERVEGIVPTADRLV